MKKFIYKAAKKQLEKPTEPKYIFCQDSQVIVYAETEEKALVLAEEKLRKVNHGTGVVWGPAQLVGSYELPTDWSYGYGDERKTGDTASIGDLVGNHVIR